MVAPLTRVSRAQATGMTSAAKTVETRVRPYYLHHPDLAPGTSHFRVPIDEGQRLVTGLRGRISGLAQPTYVLDIPGGHGKAPIMAANIRSAGDGCYTVSDWRGGEHRYPPEGEK